MIANTKYYLQYQITKTLFNRYVKKKLGQYFHPIQPGTTAPRRLEIKTSLLDEPAPDWQPNPYLYLYSGYKTLLYWLAVLEHYYVNLRSLGAILEFGCGTGRLLRHFRCFDRVRLVGTDVNLECIEWCKDNLPGVEFYCNDLKPPLSFAEDESFDLIYALSVFTHIPLNLQTPWLKEINRILRPEGIFLCTVLGNFHQQIVLNSEDRAQLNQQGNLTLTSESSQATFSTKIGGSGWDIFQTRAEVIRHFGSVFHILDYIPGAQDLLVLQKRERGKVMKKPVDKSSLGFSIFQAVLGF
jgi:SAM-dependent methyltransferase